MYQRREVCTREDVFTREENCLRVIKCVARRIVFVREVKNLSMRTSVHQRGSISEKQVYQVTVFKDEGECFTAEKCVSEKMSIYLYVYEKMSVYEGGRVCP